MKLQGKVTMLNKKCDQTAFTATTTIKRASIKDPKAVTTKDKSSSTETDRDAGGSGARDVHVAGAERAAVRREACAGEPDERERLAALALAGVLRHHTKVKRLKSRAATNG